MPLHSLSKFSAVPESEGPSAALNSLKASNLFLVYLSDLETSFDSSGYNIKFIARRGARVTSVAANRAVSFSGYAYVVKNVRKITRRNDGMVLAIDHYLERILVG